MVGPEPVTQRQALLGEFQWQARSIGYDFAVNTLDGSAECLNLCLQGWRSSLKLNGQRATCEKYKATFKHVELTTLAFSHEEGIKVFCSAFYRYSVKF